MLKIYNKLLRINHPIGISFVCGFQLSNKKSLYYTYFNIINEFFNLDNCFYHCLILTLISHLKDLFVQLYIYIYIYG